ncbi:MAG: cupin domain-containing protein, partial [Acidobacteriaceae bacterium]
MSSNRCSKRFCGLCLAALTMHFVAGIRPISAQTPATPPASTPTAPAPNTPAKVWVRAAGGNHFAGPKDVVYMPTRPLVDTRLDMYFGDWRNSEPRVMFGSLVVRDILTPGDNLSPPFPGAVLEHAKFLSYANLDPGARTTPSTLKGLQIIFYVMEGEGEVSGGGKTESIHKGSAILMPEGIEFTLRNTGTTRIMAYMIGDPTYTGFKPLSSFVVKDEDKLPHNDPPSTSPFTNPGAGGHWAHITHSFFNNRNGLATIQGIITVEILPMQIGEPHPHLPGKEEVWCEIEGKSVAFVGTQLRMQHPGEAYILRPDGLTTHANLNFEEPGDKPIKFLWFNTNT